MPSDISTRRAIEVCMSRLPMHSGARDTLAHQLHVAIQNEVNDIIVPVRGDIDSLRAAIVAMYDEATGLDERCTKKVLLGRLATIRDIANREVK